MPTTLRTLLALLCAAPLTLAAETSLTAPLHSGRIWLDLAPDQSSAIGLETADLARALCEPPAYVAGLNLRGGGGSEDCRLVVGGSGSQSRNLALEITVLSYQARQGTRTAEASVEVTDLALPGAAPFVTPCGAWSYDVRLRQDALQARNELVLEEAPLDGSSGLFVGTLRIATEIVFSQAELGLAATFALDLELDAAGRWSFLPAGSTAAGESDLALYVEQTSRGARARAGCAQDRHRCGLLCLTASTSTVDLANGLVP